MQKNNQKKPLSQYLQSFIFIIFCSVLVIRATHTETVHISTLNPFQALTNQAMSLLLTCALLFSALLWLTKTFAKKNTHWKFTFLEPALIIFTIALFIAVQLASDKRAAISESVTLICAPLMALILVQILNPFRIKILLILIVSLGITASFQCIQQYRSHNTDIIQAYEQNPAEHLQQIGITENSFEQMLYEHRLYSRDIRAFFTTGNSAGTFAILTLTAAAVLALTRSPLAAPAVKNRIGLITVTAAALIILTGLALAHSKGAALALIIAVIAFLIALPARSLIAKHKKIIALLIIIALLFAVSVVSIYAVKNDTLPGGNSMLVRHQYWKSALKMFADHPFGVGPANFDEYYTHYKIPQAPETITDPHNFILSLLTQTGPFALIAFLAAIALTFYRSSFNNSYFTINTDRQNTHFQKQSWNILLITLLAMLFIRPLFIAPEWSDNFAVSLSVYIILFLYPAITFFLPFYILVKTSPYCKTQNQTNQQQFSFNRITQIVLVLGLSAVMIHNLIDYAIFEPANYTLFWTLIAILIAVDLPNHNHAKKTLNLAPPARAFILSAIAILSAAFFIYSLLPVLTAGRYIQMSFNSHSKSQQYLKAAAKADKLDPKPTMLLANMKLSEYQKLKKNKANYPHLLMDAKSNTLSAAFRNPAGFKPYRLLTEINMELYRLSTDSSDMNFRIHLKNAWDSQIKALKRYPGSAKMHLNLAKIAEDLLRPADAVRHYQLAVDIEDEYRKQFKKMYPERKLVSRLGNGNYKYAKSRIENLKDSSDN